MKQIFSKVSIVVPVYNEKSTIEKVISNVLKADTLGFKKELIIIDDGSTDGTYKVIKKLEKSKSIKIFRNSENQGKSSCLKTGFLNSTGDIVIVQDADLEYSPRDYPLLISPIAEGYADVVYGSRFINSNPHRVLYYYHYLGNKFLSTLSNIFTNLNLTDIETGYKAFDGVLIRSLAPKLKSKRFGFEPEITARIAKINKISIYEVGISYYGRTYEEGKKITWRDGVEAIYSIIKYNIFSE